MNTSGARHQSLTRFTHLGPKSRCGAMTFSLDFGRGGIGIFGSRKSGSKCGESSPVDIRCAVFNGGIQYASPNIIGEKSDCGTSSFSPLLFYIATPSQAIDAVSQCDIIQESKMQTQSSHGLTSACIFRFLRREPCRQHRSSARPQLYLKNFISNRREQPAWAAKRSSSIIPVFRNTKSNTSPGAFSLTSSPITKAKKVSGSSENGWLCVKRNRRKER